MSQHSSRGGAWDKTRLAVLKRDGYRCIACGGEANQADHIIPKAHGGTDDLTNLQAMCRECNNTKSDRMNVRITWFDPEELDHV